MVLVLLTGSATAAEPDYYRIKFTHSFQGTVQGPVFSRPEHYSVLMDDRLEGISALTGLGRFGGDSLGAVKNLGMAGKLLLLQGRQLFALDPLSGAIVWEYPLNCSSTVCQATVMDFDGSRVLLYGFNPAPDSIMVLDAVSGKELWPLWERTGPLQTAKLHLDRVWFVNADNPRHFGAIEILGRKREQDLFLGDLPPFDKVWVGKTQMMLLVNREDYISVMSINPTTSKVVNTIIRETTDNAYAWPDLSLLAMENRKGRDASLEFYSLADAKKITQTPLSGASFLFFSKGSVGADPLDIRSPDGVLVVERKAGSTAVRFLDARTGLPLYKKEIGLNLGLGEFDGSGLTLFADELGFILRLSAMDGSLMQVFSRPAGTATPRGPFFLADGDVAFGVGGTLLVFQKSGNDSLKSEITSSLKTSDFGRVLSVSALFGSFENLGLSKWLQTATAARLRAESLRAALLQDFRNGEELLFALQSFCAVGSPCADMILPHLLNLEDFGFSPEDWGPLLPWVTSYSKDKRIRDLVISAILIGNRLDAKDRAELEKAIPPDSAALSTVNQQKIADTLAQANAQAEVGDWRGMALSLKALVALPLSEQFFSPQSEAVLDCRSLDLMPEDALALRGPELLKELNDQLAKNQGGRDRKLAQSYCIQNCEGRHAACLLEPLFAKKSCDVVRDSCDRSCVTGDPNEELPVPVVAPTDPLFISIGITKAFE